MFTTGHQPGDEVRSDFRPRPRSHPSQPQASPTYTLRRRTSCLCRFATSSHHRLHPHPFEVDKACPVVWVGFIVGAHAIFVHAKPPCIHLHWLHELEPVSLPDHPSSTTSPPLKAQFLPLGISLTTSVVAVPPAANCSSAVASAVESISSVLMPQATRRENHPSSGMKATPTVPGPVCTPIAGLNSAIYSSTNTVLDFKDSTI